VDTEKHGHVNQCVYGENMLETGSNKILVAMNINTNTPGSCFVYKKPAIPLVIHRATFQYVTVTAPHYISKTYI
jgi:hypothetical protein